MEENLYNDGAICHFYGVVLGVTDWFSGVAGGSPVAQERQKRSQECNVFDYVASVIKYLGMTPEERVALVKRSALSDGISDLFVDMAIEERLKRRGASNVSVHKGL